ncbi:zinc-binding dehydrogenase [Streptomyces sp. NPDC091219]|uniref:zinc-binding dehydrogenase n=1 Tax=Streptomyces sp. NPDC091219 TaxID=3155193 RepID=UPI00344BCFAA
MDTLIRAGLSVVKRHGDQPVIPGLDVAGTIDATGPGIAGPLQVGDRVMAMVNPTRPEGGGYAQWVVLPESWIALAPSGSTHAEAATLPMNGLTALRALDHLTIPPGGTLAVTGAAGAVGGYAVQLAKAAGHRVLADAAPADTGLVTALGADVVVPRGTSVARHFREFAPDGLDAVIDAAVIGRPLIGALRPGGTLVTLRGAPEDVAMAAEAARSEVRTTAAFVHDYDARGDLLERLRDLTEKGSLTLRVAEVLRAAEAVRAHELLEGGGVRGRIVLEF